MIRRAHIDACRHAVDDADPYVTFLGAAARLLAGTIAPFRVLSPRATSCSLAGAALAVGRPRQGAEMGRALADHAGPPTAGNASGDSVETCITNALSGETHG